MQFAVVGATGAVGQEMCSILARRRVPADSLRLLASARSAGTCVPYAGTDLTVRELTADALAGIDFALFSAGAETTRAFAKPAAANGTVVIDNSSAFRMDPNVPLVIPEVNPQDAQEEATEVNQCVCFPAENLRQFRRAAEPLLPEAGQASLPQPTAAHHLEHG